MKSITLKLRENGSVEITKKAILFNLEHNAATILVDYSAVPSFASFTKVVEVKCGSYSRRFTNNHATTLEFDLPKEVLTGSLIEMQASAKLLVGDLTSIDVKWAIVKVGIEPSINLVEDDGSITQSVAETLTNQILILNTNMADLAVSKMDVGGENSNITLMRFANGTYLQMDAAREILEQVNPDGTTLQVGSELWYDEGRAVEPLVDGDNVMFAGSQGEHYLLKKAVSSELALKPHLYAGVSTRTSAANEWIKVTKWGLVNGLNTSAWAYGTPIYYNPTTQGFTNVMPALPNARIYIGFVVRQHSTNGSILVDPYNLTLYTNQELDEKFTNYYTKAEVDALLSSIQSQFQFTLDGVIYNYRIVADENGLAIQYEEVN